MVYKSFDELEAAVMQKAHKCKVAVVEAADEHVLEAVRHAVEVGLVEPLLFGKREDIAAKLKAIGLPGDAYPIVETATPQESATGAGMAVKEGRANFILKGLIQTGVLLKGLFMSRKIRL